VRIYYKELNTQFSWEKSRYFFPTNYDSLTVITLRKNSASVVEHLEANKNIYYQKGDSLSFYNVLRLAVSIGFSLLLPDPRENSKLKELFNNAMISSENSEKMQGVNQFLHQRHRDYCLFTNFQAVFKEISSKDKIAIWGHNLHIGKRLEQMNKITLKRMGCWLKEKYGHQYATIGYIFYGGKAYAHIPTSGELQSTIINAQIPPDNSIETIIHKFTTSNLFIDIQSLSKLPIWQEPILMRCIGSQYFGKEFIPTYITNDFDALIYIQNMAPSQ
jgi:hypothetical protein